MTGNGLNSWQTVLSLVGPVLGFLFTWYLNSRKQKDDRANQLFDDMRADRDCERQRNEDLQNENDRLRDKLHAVSLELEQLQIDNINLQAKVHELELQVKHNTDSLGKGDNQIE